MAYILVELDKVRFFCDENILFPVANLSRVQSLQFLAYRSKWHIATGATQKGVTQWTVALF